MNICRDLCCEHHCLQGSTQLLKTHKEGNLPTSLPPSLPACNDDVSPLHHWQVPLPERLHLGAHGVRGAAHQQGEQGQAGETHAGGHCPADEALLRAGMRGGEEGLRGGDRNEGGRTRGEHARRKEMRGSGLA